MDGGIIVVYDLEALLRLAIRLDFEHMLASMRIFCLQRAVGAIIPFLRDAPLGELGFVFRMLGSTMCEHALDSVSRLYHLGRRALWW
jgi:hypothetical protein